MSNVSANVLIGLAAWTLFLVILMEVLRARLIMTKAIAANEFKPDNSNLSPFMQRLAGRTLTASSVCPFSAS